MDPKPLTGWYMLFPLLRLADRLGQGGSMIIRSKFGAVSRNVCLSDSMVPRIGYESWGMMYSDEFIPSPTWLASFLVVCMLSSGAVRFSLSRPLFILGSVLTGRLCRGRHHGPPYELLISSSAFSAAPKAINSAICADGVEPADCAELPHEDDASLGSGVRKGEVSGGLETR